MSGAGSKSKCGSDAGAACAWGAAAGAAIGGAPGAVAGAVVGAVVGAVFGAGAGFGGSGAGFGGSGAAGKKRSMSGGSGAAGQKRRHDDDDPDDPKDPKCNVCKKNFVIQHETARNEVTVCIKCFLKDPCNYRGSMSAAQADTVINDHMDALEHSAAAAASASGARHRDMPGARASSGRGDHKRDKHGHDAKSDAAIARQLQREFVAQDSMLRSKQVNSDRKMAEAMQQARADGKKPADGGHHVFKKCRNLCIHDPQDGRTVHGFLVHRSGYGLILHKKEEDTWDFAGSQADRRDKKEFDVFAREAGEECSQGCKERAARLENRLKDLVKRGEVKTVVLHADLKSVNIALIFLCDSMKDFMGLLELPNQNAPTLVKAHATFMSNEHRGWLLIDPTGLEIAGQDRKNKNTTVVKVHDTTVNVTLTNWRMCCSDLTQALKNALEDPVRLRDINNV